MCPRCLETAFQGFRTINFYGGGPQTSTRQGFAPSMLTIQAFRPETRTYLPFEINLQNKKYIP